MPSSVARRDANHERRETSPAHLSAHDVHDRLMSALAELQRAERNAVMWFAEIQERQLYRQLGYGSIHQYAHEALGFSKGKTSQFIRLSESLRSLPKLKRAVAAGEVPWTKAREVARVATRASEGRWIAEARSSSRRDLEAKIAASRAAGHSARRRDPEQRLLVGAASPAGGNPSSRGAGADAATTGSGPASSPLSAPVTVQLRFSPEQFARFEAMLEMARKAGRRVSREELVLEALESDAPLADGPGESAAERPTIVQRSPYQVVVYRCETCGKGHLPTSRGDRSLDLATLRAIVCDSEIVRTGKRLRASVSPGKRRLVLKRDGHRCQAAGCRQTRFLQVHHLVPLEFGGTDDVRNLITLCRPCHRWVHERRERISSVETDGRAEM